MKERIGGVYVYLAACAGSFGLSLTSLIVSGVAARLNGAMRGLPRGLVISSGLAQAAAPLGWFRHLLPLRSCWRCLAR